MEKNKIIDIDALIEDDANANRGTRTGEEMIDRSFLELGAGRSVLIDKDNRIIAGNKSAKAATKAGISKVLVIDTTGDEIIAVKRKDLDIDSQKGREMALVDNLSSEKNLEWDTLALQYAKKSFGADIKDWGVDIPDWEDEEYKPNLEPVQMNSLTTARDIEKAEEKLESAIEKKKQQGDLKEVQCPFCGYRFGVKNYE